MMNRKENLNTIPNDIILDIFLRLSANSIWRFRRLSKLWRSMLDGPYFTELFLTRSSNHPRLLFGVKRNCKWFFFSVPHPQNLYEKPSLNVAADIHMKFSRDVSQYLESCSYSSGLIYFSNMRIQKKNMGARPVICNPITGQYAILPKYGYREMRSFLGFGHINKQFKVVFMNETDDSSGINYHVLTLGTEQMRWRKIYCPLVHEPYDHKRHICINGVLYYIAQPTDGAAVLIGCFDFRSEKFKFIDAKRFHTPSDAKLINYKGKFGAILWSSFTRNPLYMWVLEDVKKQEWSEYVFLFPDNEVHGSCYLSLAGVTAKGDIVFTDFLVSKPFNVFYLNPERNTLQRVEIHGNHEVFDSQELVYTFVDHVEDLQFNIMKETFAATSTVKPTNTKACLESYQWHIKAQNVIEINQLLGTKSLALSDTLQTFTQEVEIFRETTTETSQREKIKTCGEIPCRFYEDIEDPSVSTKKLFKVIILCIIVMGVEIVGGVKAQSLTILTDAVHLLSDVACFAISIFSLYASVWEATQRRSYGYLRIEIIVNLASILLTWALSVWIVCKAITRLCHQNREIKGSLMFGVAIFGVIVDLVMVCVLGHSHHGNPHDQGAYLHVIGDLFHSVGVMIGAGLIWWKPKLQFFNLICTLIFSVLAVARTLCTTLKLLDILMETSPREIDCSRLSTGLCDMDEVTAVLKTIGRTVELDKIIAYVERFCYSKL